MVLERKEIPSVSGRCDLIFDPAKFTGKYVSE